MSAPELDIIVIAHNRLDLTIRCVDAIYQHTSNPFHLIIVDDSTDLTPVHFTRFAKEKSNCTLHHVQKPFKNSYEVINAGLTRCKTPYVAIVVNSLTVEPEWDIAGLALIKVQKDVAAVGFKCIRQGTQLIESAGGFTAPDKSTIVDMGRGQFSHRFSKVYECEAVQWAFVLLRVEAVKGTMDECPYHGWKGWEDLETCFVLRERGWKLLYCGLGVGFHQTLATRGTEAQNSQEDTKELITENLQNREIWHKKWGYWPEYHKANPQAGEFFPDMTAQARRLKFGEVNKEVHNCPVNPGAGAYNDNSIKEIIRGQEERNASTRNQKVVA